MSWTSVSAAFPDAKKSTMRSCWCLISAFKNMKRIHACLISNVFTQKRSSVFFKQPHIFHFSTQSSQKVEQNISKHPPTCGFPSCFHSPRVFQTSTACVFLSLFTPQLLPPALLSRQGSRRSPNTPI